MDPDSCDLTLMVALAAACLYIVSSVDLVQ